jgi:sulfopyruvate decarboxylase subunit alpha
MIADSTRSRLLYTSQWLVDQLVKRGYDSMTGVPCSLLGDLPVVMAAEPAITSLPATREDCAIGTAVGFALAGGRPLVMMQNSGLGMVLNATQSLAEMYCIHLLLLVTWRGEGPDAPEHLAMGARMLDILKSSQTPHAYAADVANLPEAFFAHRGPVALIVRKGELVGHG